MGRKKLEEIYNELANMEVELSDLKDRMDTLRKLMHGTVYEFDWRDISAVQSTLDVMFDNIYRNVFRKIED